MLTEDEGIKCLKVGDGMAFCFSAVANPCVEEMVSVGNGMSRVFKWWPDFYEFARSAKWPPSRIMVYANMHSKAFGLHSVGNDAKTQVEPVNPMGSLSDEESMAICLHKLEGRIEVVALGVKVVTERQNQAESRTEDVAEEMKDSREALEVRVAALERSAAEQDVASC